MYEDTAYRHVQQGHTTLYKVHSARYSRIGMDWSPHMHMGNGSQLRAHIAGRCRALSVSVENFRIY